MWFSNARCGAIVPSGLISKLARTISRQGTSAGQSGCAASRRSRNAGSGVPARRGGVRARSTFSQVASGESLSCVKPPSTKANPDGSGWAAESRATGEGGGGGGVCRGRGGGGAWAGAPAAASRPATGSQKRALEARPCSSRKGRRSESPGQCSTRRRTPLVCRSMELDWIEAGDAMRGRSAFAAFEYLFQDGAGLLGIGLPARPTHDLPDEPSDEGDLPGPIGRHLIAAFLYHGAGQRLELDFV